MHQSAPDMSSHNSSIKQYLKDQTDSSNNVRALEESAVSLKDSKQKKDRDIKDVQSKINNLTQENASLVTKNLEAENDLRDKLDLEQKKISELDKLTQKVIRFNNKKEGINEKIQDIYKEDLEIGEGQRIQKKLEKLIAQFNDTVLQEQIKVIDHTDLMQEEAVIIGDILVQEDI